MSGLTDFLNRAADFLEEIADEVDKQKAAQEQPIREQPTRRVHGFRDGDQVVLMGASYFPKGLRGTVDFSHTAYGPYSVPVLDENGILNGFPADATVRADLFDTFVKRAD